MHRPTSLSLDTILRFLQVKEGGGSLQAIQRGLQLGKSDRRPLVRMLVKLKKKKVIEELPDGRFVLVGQKEKREKAGQQTTGARPAGAGDPSRFSGAESSRPGLENRRQLSGRLILHQDGYGFVVPD